MQTHQQRLADAVASEGATFADYLRVLNERSGGAFSADRFISFDDVPLQIAERDLSFSGWIVLLRRATKNREDEAQRSGSFNI